MSLANAFTSVFGPSRGMSGFAGWTAGTFETGAHHHAADDIVLTGQSVERLYSWRKSLTARLRAQLKAGKIDRETAAFEFYPWVKAAAREAIKTQEPEDRADYRQHDILMDAANVMASYL